MNILIIISLYFFYLRIKKQRLQKKSKLETDNSVSNPSGNGIPDGLETEFSVFKTLVSNCVRLNSKRSIISNGSQRRNIRSLFPSLNRDGNRDRIFRL